MVSPGVSEKRIVTDVGETTRIGCGPRRESPGLETSILNPLDCAES